MFLEKQIVETFNHPQSKIVISHTLSSLLLNPTKICPIYFHCKSPIVLLIFFLKKTKKMKFFILFGNKHYIKKKKKLSTELNLNWTLNNLLMPFIQNNLHYEDDLHLMQHICLTVTLHECITLRVHSHIKWITSCQNVFCLAVALGEYRRKMCPSGPHANPSSGHDLIYSFNHLLPGMMGPCSVFSLSLSEMLIWCQNWLFFFLELHLSHCRLCKYL